MLPHLRTTLIVLCLTLPALAGCSTPEEPCPTCATPTDKPAECPNCTPPTAKPPDLKDPGYIVTTPWRVGDGWDYYSNQSRYHSDRVIESRVANDTTYFLIDQAVGLIGNAPQQHIRTWYDATNWTRLNVTYPGGTIMTNYTVPLPERFYKNGTFSYNQSDGNRGTTLRYALVVNVFFAGYETVALPWGSTRAGHVEYRALRTTEDGTTTREFTVRYPSAEYGKDVQYHTVSGEVFKLVAARVGDKSYGTMIPRL